MFDVQAKAGSRPVSQGRMRAMTRALLTDRFRLNVSSEKTVMWKRGSLRGYVSS